MDFYFSGVCVCAGWMWFTVKLSLTYLIYISLLSFSHSHINLFISIFTGGACSSVTLVRVWKCTHAHSIARHRRRRRHCDNNNGKSEQNNSVPSLTLSTYNHDLRWDFSYFAWPLWAFFTFKAVHHYSVDWVDCIHAECMYAMNWRHSNKCS